MKIAYASDLHLEFAPLEITNPGADVLVLAGDICTFQHILLGRPLGDRYLHFFRQCVERFPHVLYVLGNHECYGTDTDKINRTLQHLPGVTVLQNQETEILGVRFWGATLWTDLSDPIDELTAMRFMNDYRAIKHRGRRLLPQHTTAMHKESIKSLQKHKPHVVVTHHAPSLRSISPQYQGDVLNPAYASPLEHLVQEISPKVWIHGHIHHPQDYRIKTTRVLSNPRGYVGYESIALEWAPRVVEEDI